MKPVFLVFIFALTFAFVQNSPAQTETKKDLSWGVETDGLRLSVRTNPAADKILALVRNFSAKKICYCQPEGNNFTVYARKNAASEWQELKFKTPPQEIIVLPVCIGRTLKPNEDMPFYQLQEAARKKKNHSFSVDLREYSFPSDWRGAVEVKIVQSNVYCNKPRNKVGDVESRAFEIKLPFTAALRQFRTFQTAS